MTTFTLKLDTLYAAVSPEIGVVSYGRCEDEAINNLSDEIRRRVVSQKQLPTERSQPQ